MEIITNIKVTIRIETNKHAYEKDVEIGNGEPTSDFCDRVAAKLKEELEIVL